MICRIFLRAKAKIKNNGSRYLLPKMPYAGTSGGIFLLSHPLLDFFNAAKIRHYFRPCSFA
jgi:hypothetical protein